MKKSLRSRSIAQRALGWLSFLALAVYAFAAAPVTCSAQQPTSLGYGVDPYSGWMEEQFSVPNPGTLVGSTKGPLLPNPAVFVIFWGTQWFSAATNPSATQLMSDFSTITSSNYFISSTQYGTSGSAMLQGCWVDATQPPSTYKITDIQAEVSRLLALEPSPLPAPPVGRQSIFMVIMPPGTTGPSGSFGYHTWVSAPTGTTAVSPVNAPGRIVYASVTNQSKSGLTLESTMTAVFGHELLEAMTDPIPSTNWTFSGPQKNELEDVDEWLTDKINGVNVMSYWSAAAGNVVIPYAYSTTVGGNALTSYYDTQDQTPHVFYLGINQHIYEMYFNGKWNTRDLMAQPQTSGIAQNVNGPTSLACYWDSVHNVGWVFYSAADGDICCMTYFPPGNPWDAPGWYENDVSLSATYNGVYVPPVLVNPPTPLPLTTYYDSAAATQHVLFGGVGDFAGELFDLDLNWNEGSPTWNGGDLVGFPHVPNSTSAGTELTSVYDTAGHVFFVDYYGHVSESYTSSTATNGWATNDWSALSNATAAGSLPASDELTSITDTWGNHVYYINSAGDIIQLTYSDGAYSSKNITPTAYTGTFQVAATLLSPLSPVGLTSFVDAYGRIHVLYEGADGHVHELIRTAALSLTLPFLGTQYTDAWTYDDPTALTGAATANQGRLLTSVTGAGHVWAFYAANGTLASSSGPQFEGNVGQLFNWDGASAWSYGLATIPSQSNGPLAVP